MPSSALAFEGQAEAEYLESRVEFLDDNPQIQPKPSKRRKPKALRLEREAVKITQAVTSVRRKPPKLVANFSWNRYAESSAEQTLPEFAKCSVPNRRRVPRLRNSYSWLAPVQVDLLNVLKPNTRRKPPKLVAKFGWLNTVSPFPGFQLQLNTAIRAFDLNTKRIVEAILFAANKPMTIKQIQQVFPELEQPDTLEIQDAIEAITQDYQVRPIGLKQLASGYRFQVKEGMAHWVSRIFEEKPARYSRALLETLAIIAYRQPVTRGEIEEIRGVSVSTSIVQTLLEREWVRVIAHKEVPGRPALYGTTKQFLDYFNLSSIAELPTLEELVNFDFSTPSQTQTQQEPSERPQTDASEA